MKDGTIRITVMEGDWLLAVDRIRPNPLALPDWMANETRRVVDEFIANHEAGIREGRIKIEIE